MRAPSRAKICVCTFGKGGFAQGGSKEVKQSSPESVTVLVMDTSQLMKKKYVTAPKLKITFFKKDGGMGRGVLSA